MPLLTKSNLRSLIAAGDTAGALDAVLQALPQEHKSYNKFIQLHGQWKSLEANVHLGLADRHSVATEQNRITNATLEFVNELPENAFNSAASQSAAPKTRDLVRQIAESNAADYAYDLFFSFSDHDLEAARLLCDALRGYGLRVFFSADDMRLKGGHQFSEVIDDALETSRHFLLHCTPNAMQSHWVQKEYRAFHDLIHIQDPKNRRFLIFEGRDFDLKGLPFTYRNNQRVRSADEVIFAILPGLPIPTPKPSAENPEAIARKKAAKQKVLDDKAALARAQERERLEKQEQAAREQEKKAEEKRRAEAETGRRVQERIQNERRAAAAQLAEKQNRAATSKPFPIRTVALSGAGLLVLFLSWYIWSKSANLTNSNPAAPDPSGAMTSSQPLTQPTDNQNDSTKPHATPVETSKGSKTIDPSTLPPNTGVKQEEKLNPNTRKSGLDLVRVQGGTFTMGSPLSEKDRRDNECQHPVTIGTFHIGKYEVTQADWREIMGSNPSSAYKNCDQCPVDNVSWNDVQDFIKKLNAKTGKRYRLPTEAEWEYAARGGAGSKGYLYSGGNILDNVAWYISNASSQTHLVGAKKANELGIYDMSGNVWEWCQDTWAPYPSDSKSKANNGSRVLRGGSLTHYAYDCRVALHGGKSPDVADGDCGFRLAQD